MAKKEIFMLLLISLVFVSGCLGTTETKTENVDEQGNVVYEQGNVESDELSDEISDIENIENNLDDEDLVNLEYDLENINW
ncbi:MAG: hypothetical protein PHV16_03855 [Candidatus Nanoarchaeia archaeon]|nr:hypothetical protein [Candidatus Nanoarchaeia archaeon]